MSKLRVVVGALICDSLDSPTKILAARRARPKALAGRWEFPGGKVEVDESPYEALRRELREELGVDAVIGPELVSPAGGMWPISAEYVMRLFYAEIQNQSVLLDGSHDKVQWVTAEDIQTLPWLPSDAGAIPHVFSRTDPG